MLTSRSLQTLRETHTELSSARDRLRLLEDQLSTDHRALNKTENGYRDMVTERNTLLLTVYEYMEKISSAPADKVSKQSSSPHLGSGADRTELVSIQRRAMSSPSLQDSPKPFSDFNAFHNRLLERLKSVSLIQSSFERRVQQVEHSFTEQLLYVITFGIALDSAIDL